MPLIKNFLYQFSQRQQNAPHESGVRFLPLLRRMFVLLVGIWLFICVFYLLSVILTCLGLGLGLELELGLGLGLGLELGLGLDLGLGLLILIYTYTYLYLFMFILRRLKADAAYSLS